MGHVFESLRYRWTLKELKAIALVAALVAALASFALWRILSSGAVANGVVVSTGAVSVGKACGATLQIASVQLSDGRVISASVDFGGPLRPGTQVSVQKQSSVCAAAGYQVVAVH